MSGSSLPRGAAFALLLGACALPSWKLRGADPLWAHEWNARVTGARTPFEHPCATKPFIAWADDFLAPCGDAAPPANCPVRREWVDARVEQCREWTAWQLRNFHKHERDDATPEPRMTLD